jgi:gamma-glutamylcyclotransferase (GGCT)/AIG2-like uncharacterized protein YtfP
MTKVFVYGTLRAGDVNHVYLKQSSFVEKNTTEPQYTLVNLGLFPAMLAKGNTAVHGEVYNVDDRTLLTLDRLEGHPNFYVREQIKLSNGEQVNAYVMPDNNVGKHTVIESGDWFQVPSYNVT